MNSRMLSKQIYHHLNKKIISRLPFSIKVQSELDVLNKFLDNYFKIKDTNKIKKLEKLEKQFPTHPKFQLVKAIENFNASNWDFVENLNVYAQLRENWIIENNLDAFNCEFLWPGLYFGAFGNHNQIFSLIRAKKNSLRKRNLVGFYKLNQQFTNRTLMDYFVRTGNVDLIPVDHYPNNGFYRDLLIPSTFVIPFDNRAPYQTFAVSELNKMEYNAGELLALKLTDEHEHEGRSYLASFGFSETDWFVTLHMREPSYRRETKQNTTENFRNVEIESYKRSVDEVIKKGGVVVRVGDGGMTPMQPQKGLIDYAVSKHRTSGLDLFFGARCAFAITTSSGYRAVPSIFGRPQLQTNFLPGTHVYEGTSDDVFILRKLVHNQSLENIPILQQMNDPFLDIGKDWAYSKQMLSWVPNTSEELLEGTRFMISKYVELSSDYKRVKLVDSDHLNHEINVSHPYSPYLFASVLDKN
jgi:putative glycosyltransferase (TIGR04372 family)